MSTTGVRGPRTTTDTWTTDTGGHGWGWRIFAASMVILGGFFNIVNGLVGIFQSSYYAKISATHDVNLLVTSDLHSWGWAFFAYGIVMVAIGLAVFANMTWARVAGVIVVGLNGVFQLAFLPVFPFWGLVMIIVDILVIYGLVVHAEDYA